MSHRSRTSAEWMKLITNCRQSGLKDAEWCRRNDINLHSFYNAISRLRKQAFPIPDFQKLSSAVQENQQEIVEIHPGEMKRIPTAFVSDLTPVMEIQMAELSIRVSNDADPELLVRTLAILRDLVC